MKYLDVQRCKTAIFPFIITSLTTEEPASDYSSEQRGMAELEKILEFVKNPDYYPDFEDKCGYLLCSIAGAQHFFGGNKRLGVMTLIEFLIINDAKIRDFDEEGYKAILNIVFPEYTWESKENIPGAHAQFLYNLAIIIGDPQMRGTSDFDDLKMKVRTIMKFVYKLPSETSA